MFTSSRRQLVFPQCEHAQLAGHIALHWANELFDRPALPFDQFQAGVALHDVGFGWLDRDDILAMSASRRRSTFEALIAMELGDPIVEAVAKHHVLRLIRGSDHRDLEPQCELTLQSLVKATGIDAATFERADTITRLCDSIAFEFCLERATCGQVPVCPHPGRDDVIDVTYRLDGHGTVEVFPWPLSTATLSGYLLGYVQEGYPERLLPTVVSYRIQSGNPNMGTLVGR